MALNRHTNTAEILIKGTADEVAELEKRIKAAFPDFEKTTTETGVGLRVVTKVIIFNKKP